MKQSRYIVPLLLLLAIVSCKKIPKHVIPEKEMEQLLVDVHMSEGYVERVLKRATNEEKEQMRNSVYAKHGVTKEQFDTSLMWYGNNLETYMGIYDKVIVTLKNQNNLLKNEITRQNAQVLTAPGDSVNVWKGEAYHIFGSDISQRLLTFNIVGDENFKNGDKFTFSARLNTVTAGVSPSGIAPVATLGVSYKNGVVVSVTETVQPNGVFDITLDTDDMEVDRLFGNLYLPTDNKAYTIYADSIVVLRVHKK